MRLGRVAGQAGAIAADRLGGGRTRADGADRRTIVVWVEHLLRNRESGEPLRGTRHLLWQNVLPLPVVGRPLGGDEAFALQPAEVAQ